MDALAISLAISFVYLTRQILPFYYNRQDPLLPEVVTSEVRFDDDEEWQPIVLPLSRQLESALPFQIRLDVKIHSLLFTQFHLAQNHITALQVNGRSVDMTLLTKTKEGYEVSLMDYVQKGGNTFFVSVSGDGKIANFNLESILVPLRNARYRLPGQSWQPFVMPLALNKKEGDGEKIFIDLDIVLPTNYHGPIRLNQDFLDKLTINGIEVDASYPVSNSFKAYLRKYMVTPGVNKIQAEIRDKGQTYNFDVYLEDAIEDDSLPLLLTKVIAVLFVAIYGTWRIQRSW